MAPTVHRSSGPHVSQCCRGQQFLPHDAGGLLRTGHFGKLVKSEPKFVVTPELIKLREFVVAAVSKRPPGLIQAGSSRAPDFQQLLIGHSPIMQRHDGRTWRQRSTRLRADAPGLIGDHRNWPRTGRNGLASSRAPGCAPRGRFDDPIESLAAPPPRAVTSDLVCVSDTGYDHLAQLVQSQLLRRRPAGTRRRIPPDHRLHRQMAAVQRAKPDDGLPPEQ